MNGFALDRLVGRLANWPHLLLTLHLLALHALAFGGWRVPAVRLLWVAAIGLFLIWQPFVASEQRIDRRQGAILLGAVGLSTLMLGPWLLLVWCGALAAAIGGRVLSVERTAERIGYLVAFGYLIAMAVLGVVPEISPAVALDKGLQLALANLMPLILPLLLLFPAQAGRRERESFDLFYGMLVFLALAVFVLGALAYMLVSNASYIESLFKASLTFAGALLLVAWAWNPRAGFAGIGSALSRYLLSLGMPLEQWLVQLAAESERHAEPQAYLDAAMRRFGALPWIAGAAWQVAGHAGQVGSLSGMRHECRMPDGVLVAYFHTAPSPAVRWHVEWLLRLLFEFYLVKRQAEQLRRMSYVQAIHETGARVTHDVKNLLQSLQVLCYAAAQPGDPAEVAALLARQLPQIAERLKSTLDKLQSPQVEAVEMQAATAWWEALKLRYAHVDLVWEANVVGGEVPGALFDSVAENLLQNALAKRLREPGLAVSVAFNNGVLTVTDNGSPLPAAQADRLFSAPVESEDGLGIGLYQMAKQAQSLGYRLALTANRPGCVAFSLQPAE